MQLLASKGDRRPFLAEILIQVVSLWEALTGIGRNTIAYGKGIVTMLKSGGHVDIDKEREITKIRYVSAFQGQQIKPKYT